MAKDHGLFIPDVEYLVDLTGLLNYLIEKVTQHFVCFYCKPHKQFGSLSAVQHHMMSRDHCKIRYDTDDDMAEYDSFYDFSSSYDVYLKRLGAAEKDPLQNDRDSEEESEKKEAEGEGEDESTEDDKAIVLLRDNVRSKMRVSDAGHELIFSNGKAVGHRQYVTYYRQKPHTTDTRDSIRIARMMSEYKALGYAPCTEQQYNDKKIQREQSKRYMQLGVKSNKLFMVRPQVIY